MNPSVQLALEDFASSRGDASRAKGRSLSASPIPVHLAVHALRTPATFGVVGNATRGPWYALSSERGHASATLSLNCPYSRASTRIQWKKRWDDHRNSTYGSKPRWARRN